ncbi:Trp-rich small protein [Staphylococcus aureus]
MMWWRGMMALITGGLLIIFRLWLELKWKNKK